MNLYPIPISGNDTGLLENMTPAGKTALGLAVGATAGYVVGKGKLLPIFLAAGLGYVLTNSGIIK